MLQTEKIYLNNSVLCVCVCALIADPAYTFFFSNIRGTHIIQHITMKKVELNFKLLCYVELHLVTIHVGEYREKLVVI